MIFQAFALASGGYYFVIAPSDNPDSTSTTGPKPQTLNDLLKLPHDDLARMDIAEMNLLCATGLQGAEKLDVKRALKRLDEYAQRVKYWTDKSLWDFRENPAKFEWACKGNAASVLVNKEDNFWGPKNNIRGWRLLFAKSPRDLLE